ncbi:MAG: HlyD family efflux transporter periplasmic adaptor subunit [Alphaproteobacteria bacterium]|nr:HlyD family efflux transporter periplasmic adaptor subunit [Alphaproteobacteria bacterium]
MNRNLIALAIAATCTLGACESQQGNKVTGYTEGDYVYVAAPDGGWVTELLVQRGAQVKAGDPLFTLDADAQLAARNQANAQVKQAEAQLADLQKPRRPDEIAALEATLHQARANLEFAQGEFDRATDLRAKGFASQQFLDQKKSARDGAQAQVRQAAANLDLARKGARADEIAAATANVAAAKEALARAEYALSQRRVAAKVDGRIEDTLRRAGEYVPPGGAVISILPPGNIKVRFFVREEDRARLSVGRTVGIGCDGCPPNATAKVSFVAANAEYTPPVIYSIGSREKLVWLVEAVPEGGTLSLSPGQPVDVVLPAGAGPQSVSR